MGKETPEGEGYVYPGYEPDKDYVTMGSEAKTEPKEEVDTSGGISIRFADEEIPKSPDATTSTTESETPEIPEAESAVDSETVATNPEVEDVDPEREAMKQRIKDIKNSPLSSASAETLNEEDKKKVELLDKQGFAQFLAHGPEMDIDRMPASDLEKYFQSFENAAKISGELRNLYSKEISRDTGINLSKEEMTSVDDFVNSLSFEDPERLSELKEQLTLYVELPVRIGKKEAELARLCGRETLETVKETQGLFNKKNITALGWLFQTPEERAARKTVQEEMGLKLGKVTKAMEFMDLRQELFNNLGPAKELAKIAGEKAKAKLDEMFDPKANLGSLDAVQAYLDKVRGGEYGMEYFDEKEDKERQEKIDEAIELRIFQDITVTIDAMPIKSSKPLSALEDLLKKFVEKDSVGSKKRDDAKKFVRGIIRDKMEKMNSDKDKAKKILLQGWFVKNR